jgi:hypothetical protein
MKKIYKTSTFFAVNALFCLCLALPASAQRGSEQGSRPVRTDGNASSGGSVNTPPRVEVAPPQRTNVAPPQRDNTANQAPQQQQQQRTNTNNNPPQQRSGGNGYPQQQRTGVATQQQRGGSYAQPQQQRGSSYGQQRQTYGQQQRGGYYQGRGGITTNRSVYRSYPGLPYGKNRITVRPSGLYYNYRGYYGSYYTPRLGFSINVLPYGYYPFYYGPSQYFYSEGLFYQYDNNQYTVVEPPIGAAIATLPEKAQSIVINGQQYYELNGVYYQPITKDDGTVVYQVAGKDGELNTDTNNNVQQSLPQVGDISDVLPDEYRVIKLNGQKYYVTNDGYYFQDAVDSKGNKVYKIIGVPDEPGN